MQNSSFENWSGSPETPENWVIENENSVTKSTDANDGSFSLRLDLNNQISTSNQTLISTEGVNLASLATSTTYTVSFDYKVETGNTISGRLFILRDAGSFSIQHDDTSVFMNDDGNWHTFTYDFVTDASDTDYILELPFRARNAPTNIILIDNMQILGVAAPDADNDGVPDASDQCPNTAANFLAVDDNGCEVTIDQSNILIDPSFEDWSLGGGANLRDWGILIQAGGWNRNTDKNDNLQYSVQLTTSDGGTNFASIFQSDVQLYKDIPYHIAIDYKVIDGTFNTLELEFTEGNFADSVEKFTLTNFQTGWNTFTATYTPTENEMVDFRIRVASNQPEGQILLDNSSINATIGGLGPDADNDGVNDSNDNCPNTPPGATVNENGCSQMQLSTDADSDGVTDDSDNCPNTPFGEVVDANGCSQSQLDDDNDGVNNINDNCPNTPSGQSVDANGCSQSQLDDDNDGVNNTSDNCPNTPQGVAVDSEGCSVDQSNLPTIPNDGIQVRVTSTSCPDVENGEIAVSFDQDYSYTVQLKANLLDNTFDNITMSDGLTQSNLPPGTYSVCITIPEFPSFEQCFTVVLETPDDFSSSKTVVNTTDNQGIVVVSGSKNYEVFVNSAKMNFSFNDTGRHELGFKLQNGANNVVVKTDKNCQGKFEETVLVNSVRIYPNPTAEVVTIQGLKNAENAAISILNMSGVLIKSYSENLTDASATIHMSDFPKGVYLVRVKSTEQDFQTKIVKK